MKFGRKFNLSNLQDNQMEQYGKKIIAAMNQKRLYFNW
jgi:hypothetical protein